jgi:hypothetical protein
MQVAPPTRDNLIIAEGRNLGEARAHEDLNRCNLAGVVLAFDGRWMWR